MVFILVALLCSGGVLVALVVGLVALTTAEGRAIVGAVFYAAAMVAGAIGGIATVLSLSTTQIADWGEHCPDRRTHPSYLTGFQAAGLPMPIVGDEEAAPVYLTRGPPPILAAYQVAVSTSDPSEYGTAHALFASDRAFHRESTGLFEHVSAAVRVADSSVAVTPANVVVHRASEPDAPLAVYRFAQPAPAVVDGTALRVPEPVLPTPPAGLTTHLREDYIGRPNLSLPERALDDRDGRLLLLLDREDGVGTVLTRLEGDRLRPLATLPRDVVGLRWHRTRDVLCLDRTGTFSPFDLDARRIVSWPLETLAEDRAPGGLLLLFGLFVLAVVTRLLAPAVNRRNLLKAQNVTRVPGVLDGERFTTEDGRVLVIDGRPERVGDIAGPCIAVGAEVLEPDTGTYREGQGPRLRARMLVAEPFEASYAAVESRTRWLMFLVGISVAMSALPALLFAMVDALLRVVG